MKVNKVLAVLLALATVLVVGLGIMVGDASARRERKPKMGRCGRKAGASYCSPRLSPGSWCNNKKRGKIYKRRGVKYRCVRSYRGRRLVDNCGRVKCVSRRVR